MSLRNQRRHNETFRKVAAIDGPSLSGWEDIQVYLGIGAGDKEFDLHRPSNWITLTGSENRGRAARLPKALSFHGTNIRFGLAKCFDCSGNLIIAVAHSDPPTALPSVHPAAKHHEFGVETSCIGIAA
jgi:hypothetical protein